MRKKTIKPLAPKLLLGLALASLPIHSTGYALPTQGSYNNTSAANIVSNGNTMDISGKGANNVLNWQNFSIVKGETVNFKDNNNYLNLVHGKNRSEIYGALNGSGNIYLVNPNGVLFGTTASVNVGSLTTSTRPLNQVNTDAFKNGGDPLSASASTLSGDIVNMGKLRANSVKLEGNTIMLANTADITTDGKTLLTDVTLSASKDINIGYASGMEINKVDTAQYKTLDKTSAASTLGYKEYINGAAVTDKTKYDYALIHNIYELQNIKNNLNGNYMLAGNLDSSDTDSWNNYKGFDPIGNACTGFSGNFNGLGHTIDNLTINRSGESYVGLFGYMSGDGTVSNVNLTNSTIDGYSYVGALVGYIKNGTVNNVSNSGDVTGGLSAGGVVGYNTVNGVITNATDRGTVTSRGKTGGIVGDNYGSVTNAYNYADINGKTAGGVAGYNNDGTLSNLYNYGNVLSSVGCSNIGGVVGYNTGTVTNAYNYAKGDIVIGNNAASSNAGGIIGYNTGTVANVYNYAIGDIIIGNSSGSSSVGGIIGYNTGKVNDAFNNAKGNISIGTSSSSRAGGIIGYNSGTLINARTNLTGTINTNGSYNYTGGIIGYNYAGTLTTANVLSKTMIITSGNNSYTGGIIGFADCTSKVTSVFNRSTINTSGSYSYTGGIVGYNNASSIINSGYNYGNVTTSGDSSYTGGIAGYNNCSAQLNSTYNYQGNIKTSGDNSYAGGIAGYNNSIITNSGNNNSIITYGNKSHAGGIVGYNSGGKIDTVYNTGNAITFNSSSYTGGLIGYNNCAGTIKNSWWSSSNNNGLGYDSNKQSGNVWQESTI